MISFIRKIKEYLSILEIKFYCWFITFSICTSLAISYWQYQLVIRDVSTNIQTNIAISKQELNDSFDSYNAIFNVISSKIIEGENRLSERDISALLKQFYTTSKNQNGIKINFLDINWHRVKGDLINRYGTLPALNFPSHVETYTRTFPKQAYLYHVFSEGKIPPINDYFITIGVINSKNIYIGKVTILLDFKNWMHELGNKLRNQGLMAVLVGHNYTMLLSSDKAIDYLDSTNFHDKLENIEGHLKNPIELKDFTLTNCLTLEPHNYSLLFGHSKLFLYDQIFHRTVPLLLVFWGAVLIFAITQLVYSRMLKNNIFSGFSNNIKELTNANIKHIKEKKQIKNRLIKQLNEYKDEAGSNIDKLNALKLSSKEKERLELQISKRLASTLTELKETARVLVQCLEGKLNIAINYEQQLRLLANIHNKLALIATGYICYEKDDKINLETILNETLRIFTEERSNQKLSIKLNIKNTNKNLYFDEILLRQIFTNILRESIMYSKPNGKIQISADNELIGAKEYLVLKIADDGFGVSEDPFINDNEVKEQQPTLPLMLGLKSTKHIIENNEGQLQIEYAIGHGKTITCRLPYKDIKSNPAVGGNVILFKNN